MEKLLLDESAGLALAAQNDAAAVARATQEIQAALVIAQRYQRDEVRAKSKILEACKRKELAEVSEYEYSRGGTRITGPTIDLLRAVANRWGNIRFGWTEVDRRAGVSFVRCFAWDLQTNGQAERTFSVKHWRDTSGGGYELKDERDIYEVLANQAARRVRACLEEVIDSDIVTAAVDQCRRTLREGEKTPLADRAVQMVSAYAEFGVTQAMIETRLGNKLEAVSENQLASLRRIYKSLKDGIGKREDFFAAEMVKPEAPAAPHPLTPDPAPVATAAPAVAAAAVASNPPASPGEVVTKPASYNPLKALRNLAKMAKIKENELLDYWAATGKTDGSYESLEQVALGAPEVVKDTADKWPEFSATLISMRSPKNE
jgi:hypothetical protein